MYLFRIYIRLFLVCSFLFFRLFSIAQSKLIDSLKQELKMANDTTKVNILNKIALQTLETDTQKTLEYLEQAIATGEKVGFKKGVIVSNNYIAYLFFTSGDYKNAIKYSLLAEEICKKNGLQELVPSGNIATYYFYSGDYEKSLDYYLEELKKCELSGNKESVFSPLNNIGNVHWKNKQYDKALIYLRKALALSTELKNQQDISSVLKNMGNVYYELNDNEIALIYYQKTLAINEELKDSIELAVTLMNIGAVYKQKKIYNKSIYYFEKALEIHEKLKSKIEIARTLHNLGVLEYENNNYEKGIKFLIKSLSIANSIGNKDLIIDGNYELAEAYYKNGIYKSAYDHYKAHSLVKDSVFNETTSKNIAKLETEFETKQKEKEIESLTKDKLLQDAKIQSQNNLRNAFIIGFVLLILLIILAYNRYLIKQKASKEIAEKNKEITESISYAKRIQSSFLTSEKYIAKRLNDYFIYYNPRNIVSGDFYWLMEKNNKLYICTADCTGHGIPGAFMSLIGMGVLNEIFHSKTHITRTDEILNELRKIIIAAVNPEGATEEARDGMDAVMCRFDFDKMELEYSSANNSFFIIRDGELMVFKPDKMPVGKHVGDEKPFTRNTVTLQKGDCVYTFSDGYADQFGGPKGKKFQSKQLKELFLSHCHKPMTVQQQIYAQVLAEWKGENEQVDDILVIGIRI